MATVERAPRSAAAARSSERAASTPEAPVVVVMVSPQGWLPHPRMKPSGVPGYRPFGGGRDRAFGGSAHLERQRRPARLVVVRSVLDLLHSDELRVPAAAARELDGDYAV